MKRKYTTQKQKNEAKLTAIYLSIMNDKKSNDEQKSEANKTAFFYNSGRFSYEEALFRLLLAGANQVKTIYKAQTLAIISQLETITQQNQ